MSLEQDFHNFIEAQNPEEKQRGIDKVIAARQEARKALPPPQKRTFSWKKFFAIATPSAATVCVGLIVLFNVLPKGDGTRYCASSDYSEVATTQTLKEYATATNQPILYFDWYTQTDYLAHNLYQLHSGEVVGFVENFIDLQGYFSRLRFTDKNTTLEGLSVYENLADSSVVDGCAVSYGSNFRTSRATFTYGNYRYYLEVEDVSTDYVLELVALLIPDSE